MNLQDLLPDNHVILDLNVASKRAVFEAMAKALAGHEAIDADQVLQLLLERERIGTTGIGEGVAIPHAKVKDLPGLTGFFIRTSAPIDFDALDGIKVDLVFVLLAPEGASAEHLKALAKIARVFREHSKREALRSAESVADARALFGDQPTHNAA